MSFAVPRTEPNIEWLAEDRWKTGCDIQISRARMRYAPIPFNLSCVNVVGSVAHTAITLYSGGGGRSGIKAMVR